jgi:hypothetical protein
LRCTEADNCAGVFSDSTCTDMMCSPFLSNCLNFIAAYIIIQYSISGMAIEMPDLLLSIGDFNLQYSP